MTYPGGGFPQPPNPQQGYAPMMPQQQYMQQPPQQQPMIQQQQYAPQPQPQPQQHQEFRYPNDASVPQELRGKTANEALAYYQRVRDYAANAYNQGFGRQPAAQPQAQPQASFQQQQPQPQQFAQPQQPQRLQLYRQPQQQQQIDPSQLLEQPDAVIGQMVDQRVRAALAPVYQQGIAAARATVANRPDYRQFEAEVNTIMSGMSEEVQANPQMWRNALAVVKENAASANPAPQGPAMQQYGQPPQGQFQQPQQGAPTQQHIYPPQQQPQLAYQGSGFVEPSTPQPQQGFQAPSQQALDIWRRMGEDPTNMAAWNGAIHQAQAQGVPAVRMPETYFPVQQPLPQQQFAQPQPPQPQQQAQYPNGSAGNPWPTQQGPATFGAL